MNIDSTPVPPEDNAMARPKKIIVALEDEALLERLEPMLERADATMERVPDVWSALSTASDHGYDVVVAESPLGGVNTADVVESLCERTPVTARSPVVLLAQSPLQAGPERYEGVTVCANAQELLRAVAEALDLSNRLPMRLLVQLHLSIDTGRVRIACQTENISPSGMLLRKRLLQLGAVLPFDIELPEEGSLIHGRGEVVRHTSIESEHVAGVGVGFLGLDGDGRTRLSEFVQRQMRDLSGRISLSPPA